MTLRVGLPSATIEAMETLYYSRWQSPVGPLTLVASERGLMRLEFRSELKGIPRAALVSCDERFAPYRRELQGYFAGELREFTLPSGP